MRIYGHKIIMVEIIQITIKVQHYQVFDLNIDPIYFLKLVRIFYRFFNAYVDCSFLIVLFIFTATVTSLNENLVSPAGSTLSSNASHQNALKFIKSPSEHSVSVNIDDENSVVLRHNHQNTKNQLERNNNNNLVNENQKLKEIFNPSADLNRLQLANDFSPESMLQQPRNRLGLLITPNVEIPMQTMDTTPVQTPIPSQNKQGSPFYAEPADALGNVIRRSQRGNLLPKTQRHSEPPKNPLRNTQFCQVLSPIDSEKSHHISGSLDELKKKSRAKPIRSGRLDPWPVDSSWEFMCNDDNNDYDTDANWKTQPNNNLNSNNGNNDANINDKILSVVQSTLKREHRLTINQIIAKRLPELKITELLLKTTLPANVSPELSRNDSTMMSFGKGSRLSAYDNVERGAHSGYATSMICHDSTHSDDGTVFSEPWDSSQWDSFLPHDGEL